MPDRKTNRKMGKAIEAFTLSEMVNLMLDQEEQTAVTYHDDGSRFKGIGGYSVQGVTVKGKFFPLPTLAISSETRENLADLKIVVIQLNETFAVSLLVRLWRLYVRKLNFWN